MSVSLCWGLLLGCDLRDTARLCIYPCWFALAVVAARNYTSGTANAAVWDQVGQVFMCGNWLLSYILFLSYGSCDAG